MNRMFVRPVLDRPTMRSPMIRSNEMVLHEALARMRMREAEQAAQSYRLARRLTAARHWQRLARWTARRAERAMLAL